MNLRIKSISATPGGKDDEYLVMFQAEDGTNTPVRFRVGNNDGISFVEPEPDIFMAGHANARAISAAVTAFHRARTFSGV